MEKLEKLTKELALQNVEKIKQCSSDDDESAHSYEDSLHFWFIDCVSAGMYDKDEAIEIATIIYSMSGVLPLTSWCFDVLLFSGV